LIVAEVALAVVLVIGAGLLVRSFIKLRTTDPGFKNARILTFELTLPMGSYADPYRVGDFYRNFVERLRTMNGVAAVTATTSLPLGQEWDFLFGLQVFGSTPVETGLGLRARVRSVSPGFFPTLGIPRIAGRDFTADDRRAEHGVAIVNESFVRLFFEG